MSRPRKFNTPEELQEQIDKYFEWCDSQMKVFKNDKGNVKTLYKPYTVSGLAIFLDMHIDTLHDYGKQDLFSETVKKAKQRVLNFMEEKTITGVLNPTFAIFSLKHNFGWKDNAEDIERATMPQVIINTK